MIKPMKLPELQEIARKMTKRALEDYDLPKDIQLALDIRLEGNNWIFELFESEDPPQDAKVVSQTTVNKFDGSGSVIVFLPKK